MPAQLDLFGEVELLPRPARLMWAFDRRLDAGDSYAVRFCCRRCGHRTDWLSCFAAEYADFGVPCPVCSFDHLVEWVRSGRRRFFE